MPSIPPSGLPPGQTEKPKWTGAIDTALKPGWVVLVMGGAGYLLSETKVIGPLVSVLLAVATLYQINQYIQTRKSQNV